jgi:DNA-binding protein YbaB
MFDDLMNQMKNMMEASRQKLSEMEIEMERDGIRVVCNGNRVLRDISIDPGLLREGSTEELEDLLIAVINEAMLKADESSSRAMKDIAGGIMPGGLDGLF